VGPYPFDFLNDSPHSTSFPEHFNAKFSHQTPSLWAEGIRMRFLPWLQSRTAKQNEKRDGLEVQGNGFNLSSIWSFLDGGSRGNESDEAVNDATALSISTVYSCCRVLGDAIASLPCRIYKTTPSGKMEDTDAPLAQPCSGM
jgi:hypothetical protein